MIRKIGDFLPLAARAVTDPKGAAREVLAVPLDRSAVLSAAFLIIVLNMMIGVAADMIQPPPDGAAPIPFGVTLTFNLVYFFASVLLLHGVGRAFGGSGDLDGAYKVAVWLAFLVLLAQVGALAMLLVSPALFLLALVATMIFTLVQATALTMVLHGFTRTMPVFLGIIGIGTLFGFAMLMLLAALGVELPGAMPPPQS